MSGGWKDDDVTITEDIAVTEVQAGYRRWAVPPQPGGFTIADMPFLDLEHRAELVDGEVVMAPAATHGHNTGIHRLVDLLNRHAPSEYTVAMEIAISPDPRNGPEPDVAVARGDIPDHWHYLPPEMTVLAVEIVSPGSRTRDRKHRPITYADLGIRWYWRIDSDAAGRYLAAYELVGGVYKLIGEFGAGDRPPRVELTVPFPVSFDVAALFAAR
jgi:Uma2 family endonuclease